MNIKHSRETWDKFYLRLAQEYSTMSKDPSTKVGAVFVDPTTKRPVEFGYNGFPSLLYDHKTYYEDRELKYPRIIHAEMNACLGKYIPKSCNLYTWPFLPCLECMKHMIGLEVCYIASFKNTEERWQESIKKAKELAQEAGIAIYEY